MAVLFKCLYRHKSEKQKLADALINSSNSWFGINDYRFKQTRAFARDVRATKKARRQSDFIVKLKDSIRRL